MGEYIHRESEHSTGTVDYTLDHCDYRYSLNNTLEVKPCRFMMVTIGRSSRYSHLNIPCPLLDGVVGEYSFSYYLCHYQEEVTAMLRSEYPYISQGCARKVADTFKDHLHSLSHAHICPTRPPLEFATSHMIDICVREHFEEIRARPAAKASVRELVLRKVEEEGLDCNESCVICMGEMETPRSTLTMPCSHKFHQDCLLHWLDNNHVCPLCRYQLPAAEE